MNTFLRSVAKRIALAVVFATAFTFFVLIYAKVYVDFILGCH